VSTPTGQRPPPGTHAPEREAAAGAPERSSRAIALALALIRTGPVLVLALLWAAMSALSPYFFTALNLTNLLQASAVVAILAVGQLLIVLTGGIDLSAGTVVALAAVVGAKFAHTVSGSGALVVVVMLATGLAAGTLNAVLVERCGLANPFIVTLGTLSVASGAAFVISGGATITGLPPLITGLGSGKVAGVPAAALLVVAFTALAHVLTTRMRWGRWIYATGDHRTAAARVGIPVRAVSMSVFVLGGLAAGTAAIVSAGLTDAGAPSTGVTSTLDGISAVVIGGAALTGGRGTVLGALVGALILGTVHNALNLGNVNTNWEPVVLGAVLIGAFGMDLARLRLETTLRLVEARRHGDLVEQAGAA
jgi:ribose transport system permease protein